ncbi:MAG: septum formation protein Maf [Paraprevotella sp.]|nr:septum formation protein Maf [Paraprevotella sp.]
MLKNLDKYQVILASNSPRRRELLSGLDIDYTVRVMDDIDESYPDNLLCADIPCYISRKKAEAYKQQMRQDELIITADTVVCVDDTILGKPKDADDAAAMLRLLSGKTHQVITGVTLLTSEQEKTFSVVSDVTFDDLSDEEIAYYVAKYRPFDKAGAYGIQEWIGYVGVTSLKGSYFNVMGLPVQRLYNELKTM